MKNSSTATRVGIVVAVALATLAAFFGYNLLANNQDDTASVPQQTASATAEATISNNSTEGNLRVPRNARFVVANTETQPRLALALPAKWIVLQAHDFDPEQKQAYADQQGITLDELDAIIGSAQIYAVGGSNGSNGQIANASVVEQTGGAALATEDELRQIIETEGSTPDKFSLQSTPIGEVAVMTYTKTSSTGTAINGAYLSTAPDENGTYYTLTVAHGDKDEVTTVLSYVVSSLNFVQ